jgi:CDP-diacylglycerol--serine O-phosphatidyltransferase
MTMKRIRTVAVLPTMFTLANLVCGFFAIVVAARIETPRSATPPTTEARAIRDFDSTDENHNLILCGWLIFGAMVFDAFDGYVARLAKATSDFGAQLDSLADCVTFGVAPGFLLVKMCHAFTFLHHDQTIQPVWIIAAAFAACAALRLARFNVETDEEDDHFHFSGLPSPAAGGSIASFAILFYTLRLETNQFDYTAAIDRYCQMILPFYALILALLMVSRIPYPHVVNQTIRGQRSFGHIVALVFLLVILTPVRNYAAPVAFMAFSLSPPLIHAWQRIVQRREHKEPLF